MSAAFLMMSDHLVAFCRWVTECVPNRTVALNAFPSALLEQVEKVEDPPASGTSADRAEKAKALRWDAVNRLCNFPMLQRWVGVSYKPETEFHSHYGEMLLAQAYDMVVYVDRTNALNVDLTESTTQVLSRQQNRRLMKELVRIMRKPIPNIEAKPLESNILEWHFVLHGTDGPYKGGKYVLSRHGG